MAVFGRTGAHQEKPPTEKLLETYPSLSSHRLGLWREGGSLRSDQGPEIFHAGDQAIEVYQHSSSPVLVFTCPLCSTYRYKLYCIDNVWACHACQKRRHGVDYASRHHHRNRFMPALNRLRRLRKRAGPRQQFVEAVDQAHIVRAAAYLECVAFAKAAIGLLQSVADGEVTPDEAGNVMRLIEGAGKAIELGELVNRIAALEGRMPK
jgi:ribosomal protein L37AE/L43A